MKQKILYIILMITALVGGKGDVWGQTLYYVLEEYSGANNEQGLKLGNSGEKLKLNGPGATLSFMAKKGSNISVGVKLYIKVSKDNGISWSEYYEASNLSTSYKKYECTLTSDITDIQFVGNGSYKNWFYDVKVTRATTLTATPTSYNWDLVHVGENIGGTVSVSYNNTYSDQILTASCSDGITLGSFNGTMSASGSIDIPFTVSTSQEKAYEGYIYIKRNNTEVEWIKITAGIGRYAPTFVFKINSVFTGHVYSLSDLFSTDGECDYAVIVNETDLDKARIIQGKLFVLAKSGSFNINVSQDGNDKWAPKTAEHTITISDANSETYFEKQEDFSIFQGGNKTINFTFPTEKISYSVEKQDAAADYGVAVSLSLDHGESWESIGKDENITTSIQQLTKSIKSTSTHINFERLWDGILGPTLSVYYTDIKFHMASYMTPSISSVACGRIMVGNTSEAQNITIDWSDVEDYSNNLKVMCDNPNFSVSVVNNPCTPANQTWGTSNQRWGQSTVSVTYTPTEEGNHTGNIYFYDNKRFITIPVSGEAYRPLNLSTSIEPSTQITKDDHYSLVTLERVFKAGYSTVTIPFDYDIDDNISGAKAAQLAFVTYNSQDEYTLYLQEIENGKMLANQPYVVYLPSDITNPQWTDVTVKVPVAEKITLDNWTMQGNYEPGLSMAGKYGIAGGKFCLGTEGSTINAYTAYFTFLGTENVRARVAVMDEAGNTTYIGELKNLDGNAAEEVFGIDGMRLPEMRKGINIVRQKDGSVRKIVK